MSDNFKHLNRDTATTQGSPRARREAAVTAALTLIAAKVGNSPTNGGALEMEMRSLDTYADQIQQALTVK